MPTIPIGEYVHIAPLSIAEIELGKHVLCEKLPATSAADAVRSEAMLYACLNSRFRSDVAQLRGYVENGELDKV
ncbi:MAG TPA: hypothetical protein VKX96_09430, partial [Chloroflexota bacterium]|nr:hypothetical protein [Chloroflexota bacterium]